ncbi:ABC-three component system protein [Streptosporangium canum]|uniref:ABC-three component system protein n=1 Tax=Streptosporangium canum TaxID=324952 RepID=UPI003449D5E5
MKIYRAPAGLWDIRVVDITGSIASAGTATQPVDAEPPPLTVLPHTLRMASMPSPKKMVLFYDPDEFEEFVKEWVPALETKYPLVERHGGSGDHGIDVAGYLSSQRLEGEWHNYQCKRYSSALTWSTAVVEMRKMFVFAAAGHFTVPTRYIFVAPTISRSLPRTLAKPTDSMNKFLQELDTATEKIVTNLTAVQREAVKGLAAATDFSIFECVDLDEMLKLHSTTPHWAERFPYTPLDQGPQTLLPPVQPSEVESRYVQHLLDVYRERYPDKISNLEQVSGVAKADEHLKRQRVAFYTAESLRLFARDSTPPGYFEKLVEDVYDSVVEVAECTYPNGWERHGAVTTAAGNVQLTPTILTPFVQPNTRKGVCHHLANDNRLIWCQEGDK